MVDPLSVMLVGVTISAIGVLLSGVALTVNITLSLRSISLTKKASRAAQAELDDVKYHVNSKKLLLFSKLACMMHLSRMKGKELITVDITAIPGRKQPLVLQLSVLGVLFEFSSDMNNRISRRLSDLQRIRENCVESKEPQEILDAIDEEIRQHDFFSDTSVKKNLSIFCFFQQSTGSFVIRAKGAKTDEEKHDIIDAFTDYIDSLSFSLLCIKCDKSFIPFHDKDFIRAKIKTPDTRQPLIKHNVSDISIEHWNLGDSDSDECLVYNS